MAILSPLLLAVSAAVVQPSVARTGASGCGDFEAMLAQPIAARARRIGPPELGAIQTLANQSGRLVYRLGALRMLTGLEVSSDDPRFAGLRVSSETGLYHRCGYKLELRTGISDVEPSYSASFVVNRLKGGSSTEPGSFEAMKAGAMPVLEGYRPVSSWPLTMGERRYVGLMQPESGKKETVIVEFGDPDANRPTRILATFPYIFQRVTALPDLHQPITYVYVAGREMGGPYRALTLVIDDAK